MPKLVPKVQVIVGRFEGDKHVQHAVQPGKSFTFTQQEVDAVKAAHPEDPDIFGKAMKEDTDEPDSVETSAEKALREKQEAEEAEVDSVAAKIAAADAPAKARPRPVASGSGL